VVFRTKVEQQLHFNRKPKTDGLLLECNMKLYSNCKYSNMYMRGEMEECIGLGTRIGVKRKHQWHGEDRDANRHPCKNVCKGPECGLSHH